MSEIHKIGRDAAGDARSEGRYAVHPEGHLIVIPPNAPLKPGFYWASQDEIDDAGKPEVEPAPHVPADGTLVTVIGPDEHDFVEHSE